MLDINAVTLFELIYLLQIVLGGGARMGGGARSAAPNVGVEQTPAATWQATWTAAYGTVTPYDQPEPDAAGEAFLVWTSDRSER